MSDAPSVLVRLTKAHKALADELGQPTFSRLRAADKIGPRETKLGGSVFYNAEELRRWAASAKNGELPNREEWRARNGGQDA